MATRFTRPHIDISSRAVARPHQAPQEHRGGGSAPRVREQHGLRLQAELAAAFQPGDAARTVDDRLGASSGVYLEVELRRGEKAGILERKTDGILPGAARTEPNESTRIALLVPDAARPVLESILRDYTSGPLTTIRHEPPRKEKVEAIEAIRRARLETLWTDDLALLREFGYGVPSYERAVASAANHFALVAQNTITPFRSGDGRRFRDSHFYRLPWPKDILERLGERDVRLEVTLSYFIEPNPGSSAAIDPQRYQSFGLRFDLRRRLETDAQFVRRAPRATSSVSDLSWGGGEQEALLKTAIERCATLWL